MNPNFSKAVTVLHSEMKKAENRIAILQKKEADIKATVNFFVREPKTLDRWYKISVELEQWQQARQKFYQAIKAF